MSNYIQNIEISNFKSIRHQKIEGCKRINVFIGYPNVGKSNILEALGCMGMGERILKKGSDKNFLLSDFMRLDTLRSCFFEANAEEKAVIDCGPLKMEISFNEETIQFYSEVNNSVSYSVSFNELFGIEYSSKSEGGFIDAPLKNIDSGDNTELINHIPYHIRKYDFNAQKLREKPSTAKTYLNFPYGENLMGVLLNNKDLREEASQMLSTYGYQFVFDNHSPLRVFRNIGDNVIFSIDFTFIADTLQRVIFHKAAIASNKESVLIFEEPEAHMFPPYIRKFTSDVVFDKTNQFFIATHSPYVLDEFIEEALDDLAIYLVDYKNGETIIKNLSKENLEEIREFGVDLFFNLESYLKNG